jgi:chromosome segregation ATPase
VSSEPSLALVDCKALRESLAEISAGQQEFYRFFSGIFDELEVLSDELVRRQQAWLAERQRTENELKQRAERLEHERGEMERLRHELADAQAERQQAQPDEELQGQFQEAERARSELQEECRVLETELESVRNRAAELTESLAEQRRQTAAEREQWTQELKRMRRLLEMLSTQRLEPVAAGGAHTVSVRMHESSPPPTPQLVSAAVREEEPALASVMAQFEMLQKDLARRRRGNGNPR